jgi:ribosomal protein S11
VGANDRPPFSRSPEEEVSRKQWVVTVVLGLLAVVVLFCSGSYVGLYLTGAMPTLTTSSVGVTPSTVENASPAVAEEPSPTQTRPTTAPGELPTATSTPGLLPVTPPPVPSTVPQEPFAPDEWEPDGSAEEAHPIEVGGVQRHNLDVGGDSDWLYFEARAGQTYVVETSELGREVDTVIRLFDGQGNELALDDDGGVEFLASRLWWTARGDGSLYVVVRGLADTEAGRGTEYSISLRVAEAFEVDEYEPDDSRATASLIEVGQTQRHNRHTAGDEDWISFEVQQGITYVVQTLNLGVDADTVIHLYDSQGNELALDDDGGEEAGASRLEWTAVGSGVRYVKVEDWLQNSSGPGTQYEVALSLR